MRSLSSPLLLRLGRQQIDFLVSFSNCPIIALVLEFAYYSFSPLHLELKWQTRPIWAKSIPIFRPKRRKKPHPLGRHIPIWLISEFIPPVGLLVAVPSPRQRKNVGRVWLHVGYPPGLAQCKQVFVYYTGAIWYSVDMPLPTHKTHGCLVDLFTDTAAILNQLDLRSIIGCLGCMSTIRYIRSVFTRAFWANFSFSFPRKRL